MRLRLAERAKSEIVVQKVGKGNLSSFQSFARIRNACLGRGLIQPTCMTDIPGCYLSLIFSVKIMEWKTQVFGFCFVLFFNGKDCTNIIERKWKPRTGERRYL